MVAQKTTCICQLPKPYSPALIQAGEWISISRKLNGVHAIFKNGKLYTREKRVIPGVEHIIEDCYRLSEAMGGTNTQPFVIEGELLIEGDFEDEFDRFTETCSLVSKTSGSKSELKLYLFDAVNGAEYASLPRGETESYTLRRDRWIGAYNAIADELESLSVVPFLYEGYDLTQIEKWFQTAESSGWEGIVINKDVSYVRSKNTNVLKYKHIHTMDLPIVDFKPGVGRYRGMLGALIVSYKGNAVAVGTGMDIPTREYIWLHRPELLGRVVEIQYQCKTKNSLQFPVYRCIRPEGKEVNEGD